MLGVARFAGRSSFRFTDDFDGDYAALTSPYILTGSWFRSSGVAICTTAGSSNPMALVDAATPDVVVSAQLGFGGDCLVFRYVDANNWWRIRTVYQPGGPTSILEKTVASTYTLVQSLGAFLGDYSVRCVGSSIRLFSNGAEISSGITSSDLSSATKHGLGRGESYWESTTMASLGVEAI